MASASSVSGVQLFAVLKDWHRCAYQIDCSWACDEPLTDDMSINAWADAVELEDPISTYFSSLLGVQASDETWKVLLRTPDDRSILDLCIELAPLVRIPRLQPIEILGSRCLAAAVFRHFESIMQRERLPRVAPSRPLAELEPAAVAFISLEAGKLAPGVMPVEEQRNEHDTRTTRFCLKTCLIAGMGSFLAIVILPSVADVFTAISIASGLFGCARAAYRSYRSFAGARIRTFGEHETLADLCRAIAEGHRTFATG